MSITARIRPQNAMGNSKEMLNFAEGKVMKMTLELRIKENHQVDKDLLGDSVFKPVDA